MSKPLDKKKTCSVFEKMRLEKSGKRWSTTNPKVTLSNIQTRVLLMDKLLKGDDFKEIKEVTGFTIRTIK